MDVGRSGSDGRSENVGRFGAVRIVRTLLSVGVACAVGGDALAGHRAEETAECGRVLETEVGGDLLGAQGSAGQQAACLREQALADDAQRGGVAPFGKQVAQRLGGAVQQGGVVGDLVQGTEVLVHKQVVAAYQIVGAVARRMGLDLLAGDAGAGDDQPFELQAQHLFVEVVPLGKFFGHLGDDPVQTGTLFVVEFQPQGVGRSVEQHAAARDVVRVAVNAVEVAVEGQHDVFARIGTDGRDLVQGGDRDQPAFFQAGLHTVDFERQRSLAHINQAVEIAERQAFGERVAQRHIAAERCVEGVFHGAGQSLRAM